MGGKRKKRYGITRQHAEALGEVIAFLEAHPETTPLELGVLNEVRDRLARHAKDAAIVRVRLKNGGDRFVPKGPNRHWSEGDTRQLRAMIEEGVTAEEIVATFPERTREAVLAKARTLGYAIRVPRSNEWTAAELETLERAARRGMTMLEASKLLPDRQRDAIAHKAGQLKIRFRLPPVSHRRGRDEINSPTLLAARRIRKRREAEMAERREESA